MLTRDNDVAVGRNYKVKRAELRIGNEPRRFKPLTLGERDDGVFPLATRADARGEKQRTIAAETKAPRKRHDAVRQNPLSGRIQRNGECHESARAAQADVIATIRPEAAAARV